MLWLKIVSCDLTVHAENELWATRQATHVHASHHLPMNVHRAKLEITGCEVKTRQNSSISQGYVCTTKRQHCVSATVIKQCNSAAKCMRASKTGHILKQNTNIFKHFLSGIGK